MKNPTILLYYVWVMLLLSKGFAQFRFDTNFDRNTNEYVAKEEASVQLACTPTHRGATNVGIYQLEYVNDAVAVIVGTYELIQGMNREFATTIGPLTLADSTAYMCQYNFYRCNPRSARCEWWVVRIFRSLYVIPAMPLDDIKCSLVDWTNGIFFTGDQLILRCTGNIDDGFQVSIRDENTVVRYVELTDREDSVTGTTLIITPRIEHVLHEAMIYCGYGNATDNSNDDNYCNGIRRISVFADVTVTVSPNRTQVPNGGNATLTCQSNLFSLASSSEWGIMEEGVVTGHSSMSSSERGTTLTLTDISFAGSTSGMFTVSCNVTVGMRSTVETIAISEERIPTSTFTTEPSTNASSTTFPSTNAASASIPTASATPATDDMESAEVSMDGGSTAIVIAIPVAVGFILVCTVAVIVITWKCKTSTSKKDATPSSDLTGGRSPQQRDSTGFRGKSHNNYSYEESFGDARVGYSSPDDMLSVDNVAYVSYVSEKP